MLRREFVRAVVVAGFAPRVLRGHATFPAPPPPAPVPWTQGLNPKTPLPHTEVADGIAEAERRFFTPVQMVTLMRLCDVLMPPIGNKPGALQAETPLFLDFLIGESPVPRKAVYSGGLNWLEAESQKRYSKAFAKLEDREADAILKPWLRTWMNDHPPTEMHADFVNIAHEDIRTATVNSKAWSDAVSGGEHGSIDAGLYWYPIEADVWGRGQDVVRTPLRVTDAPKASHTLPAYPR
jgi:Gluconate 2-dehydrogenase subunit 3